MYKTREAQINRLKEILAVPTFFRKEHDLIRYLINVFREAKYDFDLDEFGNLYVTKGVSDVYPLVCAHTDSVQENKNYEIEETLVDEKLRLIGKNKTNNRQCGIGADDKAGVFVYLELLDIMPVIKVALFTGEEFGCIGSHNAKESFFENVGYIIEFDCPDDSSVTYHCNGAVLFDVHGTFYNTVANVLLEHMPKPPTLYRHPYTDVWQLKTRFPISCINIATGYYNYHMYSEYVVVDDVLNAVKIGEKVINNLGNQKYPFKSPLNERITYETTQSIMRTTYPEFFQIDENELADSYISLLNE